MDQTVENYSPEHFRSWNDSSRENLGVETVDLVQLHCPPTDLYYHPEVFEDLDAMVREGRLAAYGVSVETRRGGTEGDRVPERGHRADHLQRLPPAPGGCVFRRGRAPRGRDHRARAARLGPVSGRYTRETAFAADDHRSFNRHGEAFDVGETFAGVPSRAAWTP